MEYALKIFRFKVKDQNKFYDDFYIRLIILLDIAFSPVCQIIHSSPVLLNI